MEICHGCLASECTHTHTVYFFGAKCFLSSLRALLNFQLLQVALVGVHHKDEVDVEACSE